MKISVIIPSYQRPETLAMCLDYFRSHNYAPEKYEIIVIDDGSSPTLKETVDLFRMLPLKYLYQKNSGPSAARNLGIREARGEIVAFIDDDCIPRGRWLDKIEAAFQANPGFSVIQGLPVLPNSRSLFVKTSKAISEFANEVRIKGEEGEVKLALFFGSGNACIKRNFLIEQSLLFDEELTAREDEDLYRRMEEKEIKILYFPDISVLHLCDCSPRADFVRYFGYGRGECILRRKWGNYTRLVYDITLDRFIRKYKVFTGTFMYAIWVFRMKASAMGFKYEEKRTKRLKPNFNLSNS